MARYRATPLVNSIFGGEAVRLSNSWQHPQFLGTAVSSDALAVKAKMASAFFLD